MTDDPTPTAEQVATEAIRVACFEAPKATSSTEWRSRIERILSDYRSALRSSPEALADLNGGEWVQFTGQEVVVHHAPGFADDGVASIGTGGHSPIPPEVGINGHVGTWTTVHPVAYFVLKGATDG